LIRTEIHIRMRNLLNDFVLELMKSASHESFNPAVLQKKFDAWKEEHVMKEQHIIQLKKDFLDQHTLPRKMYQEELEKYMTDYAALRNDFTTATDKTRKAALNKWFGFSANVPEILLQPQSTLYTMYPYDTPK
jgi:hypothetical protein